MLEPELIGLLVALGARGLDRRSLRFIEEPELDGGQVGIDGHLAAEGIDLANHLTLGLTPDGGVAAHLGDGIDIARQE